MKKTSKKTLTRKLDRICSDIIRLDPCAKCGEVQYDKLQCAHIFSRTYRSVRWFLGNMLCLCAKDHFWAHKNPILFTEFIRERLGIQYETLKSLAVPIKKWTIPEMQAIFNELVKAYEDKINRT